VADVELVIRLSASDLKRSKVCTFSSGPIEGRALSRPDIG